jgi:hypothetical protein
LIPDLDARQAARRPSATGAETRGSPDDPSRQVLPAKLEKLFR